MGADLYIESITEPARKQAEPRFNAAVRRRENATAEPVRKAAQAEVEAAYDAMYPEGGYFRDSYNGTCVLARVGLSWWNDVVPMLDDDRLLSVQAAGALAVRVEEAELDLPDADELKAMHCAVSDEGENSPEAWAESYRSHRKELVTFLRRAVDMGEPVRCSL